MKKTIITFFLLLSFSFAIESEKTALVTGITGQDGPYMAKLLIDKGYGRVYGSYRRSPKANFSNLEELGIKNDPHLFLVEMDITDLSSVQNVIREMQPNEIYNFAAQSFVGVSFKDPLATFDITGKGPLNILEAIRFINPKIKFYQASTSELFGKVQETPQKETTAFYPRSPYGVAKLSAHWSTINYRESYGLFACCGILFNHESPLRGYEFVTRKITQAVARIKTGKQECLELGNLDSRRDWGFAGDYVEGAYLMLQQESPDDYVISTGRTETVRFFVEKAFLYASINIEWQGEGVNEYAVDKDTGKTVVRVDPKFYRPTEVDILIGDATKAKTKLGWQPKVQLEDLIKMMVDSDLKK